MRIPTGARTLHHDQGGLPPERSQLGCVSQDSDALDSQGTKESRGNPMHSSGVPAARLGILQSERQGYILLACKVGSPQCLSKRVRGKRGASMHMVSEKDVNSAELETMKTPRSPTTEMTATAKCEQIERRRNMSHNWTDSSTSCFYAQFSFSCGRGVA